MLASPVYPIYIIDILFFFSAVQFLPPASAGKHPTTKLQRASARNLYPAGAVRNLILVPM